MKKILLLHLWLLLLVTSCDTQENDHYDFEGLTLGPQHSFNVLTVFVEDNLGGNEISIPDEVLSFYEDYEVEAYQLYLTKDTKLIIEETGEEFQMVSNDELFSSPFENVIFSLIIHPHRKVAVKVEEAFSSVSSTDRKNHILYDRSFLPIYKAEEIRFSPLTFEDFVKLNTTYIQPDEIAILAVYDPSTDIMNNYYFEYEDFWSHLENSQNGSKYVTFQTWEASSFEEYRPSSEYQQYPIFFILDQDGILHHTHDWEDATEFAESVLDN